MSSIMLLALIVALTLVFVIAIYNKMIKMRNHADEAWSDIDVQLKRRYNLIPNIIETVKGYATHEEKVFTKVTEARSNAINAGTLKEQAQAENLLTGALKSLFAVAENYPNLRANENFMQLQNELVDTEDKIQAARRFYNSTVRDYNTKLQQFPNSIVAKMFKFDDKEFFEVEDEAQKEVVKVSFDKKDDGEKKEETKTDGAPAAASEAEEKPAETPAPTTPAPEAEKPAEAEKVVSTESVTEVKPAETESEVQEEKKEAEEIKTQDVASPEEKVEPATTETKETEAPREEVVSEVAEEGKKEEVAEAPAAEPVEAKKEEQAKPAETTEETQSETAKTEEPEAPAEAENKDEEKPTK